jgi:hypothetical protein
MERPILMKGPLVRRSLKGEKTETRRLFTSLREIGKVTEVEACVKPTPPELVSSVEWVMRDAAKLWHTLSTDALLERCPYGLPDDRLWVRETWAPGDDNDPPTWVWYRADESMREITGSGPGKNLAGPPDVDSRPTCWKPSIFLPRDACRLQLQITQVRVERLQDTCAGPATGDRFVRLKAGVDSPPTSQKSGA